MMNLWFVCWAAFVLWREWRLFSTERQLKAAKAESAQWRQNTVDAMQVADVHANVENALRAALLARGCVVKHVVVGARVELELTDARAAQPMEA